MSRSRMGWLASLSVGICLGVCAVPAPAANPTPRAAPHSAPSTSGEISGKLFYKGAKPKLTKITMEGDRVCAAAQKGPIYAEDGELNSNGTLPNAFIYIKSGAEKDTFRAPREPAILDQRRCVYVPHVLGVMVGQELKILSSDPTVHNVHLLSKENRDWNQTQLPGADPLLRKFNHPEVMIPVECNLHPWMKAYVGVTSNPFYAVTGKDGSFVIRGLPPGNYTIAAWTATFGAREQQITVQPNQTTQADFTFGTGQ